MAQVEIPSYKRIGKDSKKEQKKNVKIKLEKSDYISAAFSFLMARASMFGQISPFSLAFFCASYTKKRMPLTLLLSLAGYLSTGMGIKAIRYLTGGLVFFIYKIIFAEENKYTHTIDSVVSAVGLFAGGMVEMMLGVVLMYDVAILILECVLCAFMSMIFNDAVMVFEDRDRFSKYITNENMLSMLIILGISLAGISSITKIGPINIGEIICAAAVLLMAYCRGMSIGACAGACVGIICSMNGGDFLQMVGIYTVCGFLAGCAASAGKYASAAAFILSAASLGFMTTMYVYGNVGIMNFLFGTILFIIIPADKLNNLVSFLEGYYISPSQQPYMKRMQKEMCGKMNNLADTLGELSESLQQISQQSEGQGELVIFDETTEKICTGCGLYGHCWEKESETTKGALDVIRKKIEEKGYADVLDLPQDFRKKCVRCKEFVSAANYYSELWRINSLWEGQLSDSRNLLSGQYKEFSAVIKNFAQEMSRNIYVENKYEKKITSELLKNKISVKSVCVFERKTDEFEVEVEFCDKDDMEKADVAGEVISKILSHEMRMTESARDTLCIVYEPVLRYKMISGAATMKKDGQKKNGDAFCAVSLNESRYMLAISDGMGSGEEAAKESSMTTELIKKLFLAGFDKKAVIQLINSALVIRRGRESFATIDLTVVDLVSGAADFIKVGAATGYIKRKNMVESVFCNTLPAGILSEADMALFSKRLVDGDIIVMVSDGVANARKNTGWVYDMVCEIDENEAPDAIAEIILKQAVINRHGKADDDMTVIAAKIMEK